jgi:hypothetical protein
LREGLSVDSKIVEGKGILEISMCVLTLPAFLWGRKILVQAFRYMVTGVIGI